MAALPHLVPPSLSPTLSLPRQLAIYLGLARGGRIVYTTPLKALSNQKYQDLQKRFGRERVGLMTGDACLNADSDILVMTTEVFRNMLLEDDQALHLL